MRSDLRALDYDVVESPAAIIPIIIGDTPDALRLSDRLLDLEVFLIGFGLPIVPEGAALLRVQMSASHTNTRIDVALNAFRALKDA